MYTRLSTCICTAHTRYRLSTYMTYVHTYSAKASIHMYRDRICTAYIFMQTHSIHMYTRQHIWYKHSTHMYTDIAHLHTAHTCTHGLSTCRAHTCINMYRQHTHIHSLHVCTQSTCMQNPHVHMCMHTHICTTGGSTGRRRVSACIEHKDSGWALPFSPFSSCREQSKQGGCSGSACG